MSKITTTTQAAAMIRAAAPNGAYALRRAYQEAGIVPAGCREVAWYYYARNGGTCRRRAPGMVANMTRRLVGGEDTGEPATWCGHWGRTLTAERAEREGARIYRQYAALLAVMPIRELVRRIKDLPTTR